MKARRALPLFTFATDRAIQAATPERIDEIAQQVEVDDASGCWLWTGYLDPSGYGIVSLASVKVRVHRATFWWFVGPISHTVDIDHACRVRHCCNPDHLQAVSHAENVNRGDAGKHMAAKTHCPRGHPYDGENLYVHRNGNRQCRACQRDRIRLRRANQRTRP